MTLGMESGKTSVQRSAFSVQRKKNSSLSPPVSGEKSHNPKSEIRNPKLFRLGLFGGAFNPVHLGHLRAGLEIQEAFSLNKVIFIPTALPPHKETRNLVSFAHRLQMVRLAVAGVPSFKASDVERKMKGKSYSIRTIRHFMKTSVSGTELFFILGLDAFLEIHTWKEFRRLFTLCHFVVMDRPGYNRKSIKDYILREISSEVIYYPREKRFLHPGGPSIFLFPITLLDISSTRIRRLRQNNQSLRFLLPEKVGNYILENRLYAP
ncbi:MAG: nicotinate-nucleotide adenylyltransferase [Thermodesulfobacteriota bacterium]